MYTNKIKKYFWVFLLPAIWAPVSFISYYHPGDEYALYAISNIIGLWFYLIIKNTSLMIPIQSILFPITLALAGGIIMALIGFGADKLQINRRLWLSLWLVLFILVFIFSVNSYPTLAKALSKNGSWTAYAASSLNIALYLSIIFAAVTRLIHLKIKK